ncbi:hypothetical protein [Myroides pelagicus]|uniref:Uncharacterized protein n=1 Tax=Myroides pelagicus TaxID=270914 RepID=A0A7K1GQ18_9FLAO|nr:hypothetical protein [Myroides pelagicus]MTH30868.1 hypothetical protein [Myroides pelagicus]
MGDVFRNIGYIVFIIIAALCMLGILGGFFEQSRTNDRAAMNVISYVAVPILFVVALIVTTLLLILINFLDGQVVFYDIDRFLKVYGYSSIVVGGLFILSLFKL